MRAAKIHTQWPAKYFINRNFFSLLFRGNQEMVHAPTGGYQRFVGTTTGTSDCTTSSGRISRMARSLPQHVPEVLTRPPDSSSSSGVVGSKPTPSHSFGGGGGVMNRLHQTTTAGHHHLLTGSLSAPSSPSQLSKSSSIPLKMRQSVARQGAPPPNIIVEKGRIEFVKTSSTSTTNNPPVETQLPTTEKHKLQMGTKIFRPPSSCSPSPKKSNSLPQSTTTDHQEMPPKGVKSQKEPSGGSISFRDRSASPKFNSTRESTPPLPDSKIPSGLMRMKQPATTPDVVRANHLPRPGFINKSRETSPSPQQQQQQQQQQSCSSAKPLSSIPSPSNKCASNNSSAGSVNGAAVPVSPNLIRWRAKLSGSSGPCVTNHLNLNVSAAAAAANNLSIAGSHPKKTPPSGGASLVKLSGNGDKSCLSSSYTTSSKPSTSAPPPSAQVNIIQFQFKFPSFCFLPKLGK